MHRHEATEDSAFAMECAWIHSGVKSPNRLWGVTRLGETGNRLHQARAAWQRAGHSAARWPPQRDQPIAAATQNAALRGVRGKGITSRMFAMPVA
jgi:hypothetical protein